MIITFLYRILDSTRYGKYIGAVSDDYEEGLDIELRNILYPLIANYYFLEDLTKLQIGILSAQRNGSDYYSEEEKNVFDLLYCKWSNQREEIFLHGIRSDTK
jgi:hypothetical protein